MVALPLIGPGGRDLPRLSGGRRDHRGGPWRRLVALAVVVATCLFLPATADAGTPTPRARAAHQATCDTYWFDTLRGFYRKPRVLYHYCVNVGGAYGWVVIVGYSFKHYVYLGHHW